MPKLEAGMTRDGALVLLQAHNAEAFHIEYGEPTPRSSRRS